MGGPYVTRLLVMTAAGGFIGAVCAVCLAAVWPNPEEVCTHEDDPSPSA